MKRFRAVLMMSVILAGIALPVIAQAATKVTIRGTLTVMQGTSAPTALVVTSGSTNYTVNVTSSTKLVRKFLGLSTLEEFMVGDSLEIVATTTSTSNTVDATRIRNVSIQRRGGTFRGTVGTINCSNKSFSFTPAQRAKQTVYLSSSTVIIRNGEKLDCSLLTKGESATIIGLWRSSMNRIDADRIILHPDKITGTIVSMTLNGDGVIPHIVVSRTDGGHVGELWTVRIKTRTHLVLKKLQKAVIEQFGVGDSVRVIGKVKSSLVITADLIRNLTTNAKLRGSIVSKIKVASGAQSQGVRATSVSSTISLLGWSRAVAQSGNYVYVADGDAGLEVVDYSNPAHPVIVGNVDTGNTATAVTVAGSYAYVGDSVADMGGLGAVKVVDISTPSNPSVVGSVTLVGAGDDVPTDIAVSGSTAVVANDGSAVFILDISNPASPSQLTFYNTNANNIFRVAISGDYAYLSGSGDHDNNEVEVINISTPASPTLVARYAAPFQNTPKFLFSGTTAFVSDYTDGLETYDTTNPADLLGFGSGYYIYPNYRDMVMCGNSMYLIDSTGALVMLDVTHPETPKLLGRMENDRFATARGEQLGGLACDGTHVYALRGADVEPGGNVLVPATIFAVKFD